MKNYSSVSQIMPVGQKFLTCMGCKQYNKTLTIVSHITHNVTIFNIFPHIAYLRHDIIVKTKQYGHKTPAFCVHPCKLDIVWTISE